MSQRTRWIEDEDQAKDFPMEHPLDRHHRWAMAGTAVAQGGLLIAAAGHLTLVAQLMCGYLLALAFAVGVASLGDRDVADEIVAGLGTLGALAYLFVAGHLVAWAPPVWLGVACLAVVVTTDSHLWSALRALAILATCGALAVHETGQLASIGWAAAAAVPFAFAQWQLARAGQADRALDLEAVPAE